MPDDSTAHLIKGSAMPGLRTADLRVGLRDGYVTRAYGRSMSRPDVVAFIVVCVLALLFGEPELKPGGEPTSLPVLPRTG